MRDGIHKNGGSSLAAIAVAGLGGVPGPVTISRLRQRGFGQPPDLDVVEGAECRFGVDAWHPERCYDPSPLQA